MATIEIVIPSFNEARSLEELLPAVKSFCQRNPAFSFLVVDNGSTDDSPGVLDRLTAESDQVRYLRLDENVGYGGGVAFGLTLCKAEYVGWMHADLQYELAVLSVFGAAIESNAPSMLKGLRCCRPLMDRIFTYGMGLFTSLVWVRRVTDVNGQPTLLKRSLLPDLSDSPSDFTFDLWILASAGVRPSEVYRVPLTVKPRAHGSSSWNDGFPARLRLAARTSAAAVRLRGVRR
jgi:glycosyltransferase involved in cell wall biosynthesis